MSSRKARPSSCAENQLWLHLGQAGHSPQTHLLRPGLHALSSSQGGGEEFLGMTAKPPIQRGWTPIIRCYKPDKKQILQHLPSYKLAQLENSSNRWECHIHTGHSHERPVSCFKKGHKPSKTPEALTRLHLKPSTGPEVCCRRECKTPQCKEFCFAWNVPMDIWMYCMFRGTPIIKRTRKGQMGHCWIHRGGEYLST